jgi:hypothetical protein
MNRLIGLVLLGLAAIALTSCTNRQTEWRSKITVNVETPGGLVSGSSVTREVASHTSGALVPPEARGGGHGRFGEAVVVEVAPGKFLFALLPGLDTAPELDSAHVFFPGQPPAEMDAKFATLRESRVIPANLYPMLVTFGDVKDPKSVKIVDPKNLAASFGPGYRLKDMVLEITDEAVTEGRVDSVLTWLVDHKGRLIPTSNKKLRDVTPEENLRRSNFKDTQP